MQAMLHLLIDAVLLGAREVLATRTAGPLSGRYKDATEYVTLADERSDHAMRALFEERVPAIDPSIAIRLEESGGDGAQQWVGADPLDGTNHFAAGGNLYSIQAHFAVDGVPEVGVVFQPEVFMPLTEGEQCLGRLVYAIRGGGAFVERTRYLNSAFERSDGKRVNLAAMPAVSRYAACVAVSSKMTATERERAQRVLESGLIAVGTGAGGAGANVMMTIFGGHHVYANFGAGDDLDLMPPQVIALEAGLTVWGADRRPPVWNTRKQPAIFARTPEIADAFLRAAGL